MKKSLGIIIFTLLFTAQIYPYNFKAYKVEHGLSQNTVWCILQDHKGFIWLGTKDGLNRFDGYEFKIYTHDTNDPHSIGNNFIRSLYQDSDQNIWVGTDKSLYIFNPETEQFSLFDMKSESGTRIEEAVNSIVADKQGNVWLGVFGQGLFLFQKASGTLHHFKSDGRPNSLSSNLVWSINIDKNGTVWIGTLSGGLNRYNPDNNTFSVYKRTGTKNSQLSDDIYCIYNDSQNNLWVGTWNWGVSQLNRTNDTFTYLPNQNDILDTHIRSIHEFDKNHLLFGTEKGLFLYDKRDKSLSDVSELGYSNGLSDKSIYAIYQDREEGFWIGTYFGGVNYLHKNNQIFQHWAYSPCMNSIRGKAISQICEDDAGSIWIATEDNGLNRYIKSEKRFVHYHPSSEDYPISHDNLHALLYDDGKLWIGSFTKGIDVLDIPTQHIRHYEHQPNDIYSLSDNGVYSIYKDRDGNIYIGTIRGLNIYNPSQDNFKRIKDIGDNTYVYDIIQDSYGYLWFATYGTGVYKYDPHACVWTQYRNNPSDSTSLCHDKIISLLLDSNNRLWLGSEGGGLCEYDYNEDNFQHRENKNSGLSNDVIYSMIEDNFQNIWLSTNNSLICYNPTNDTFKKYTFEDGLQSNQFNYKSGFKSQHGELYFGGVNGLNIFNPANIKENTFVPPVSFTKLSVNNKWIEVGAEDSLLRKSIIYSDEIVLKHYQSNLSFNFVSLSFCSQQKNQYAYKLEPVDSTWNYIGERNNVSFNNIPHGNYVLHVKASNNDNLWNNNGHSIKLTIKPPIWDTIFARILYIIALISLSASLIIYFYQYSAKKHAAALSAYKRKREKEMYESKITFFTNIAHEIRTPLSLIKAPLESIIKKDDCSKETKENLQIMQLNTERLHSLIDQLLDFRKISEGKIQLNKMLVNLNTFIEKTVIRFQQKCNAENITLEVYLPKQAIYDVIDEESMTKVLSNLLTNAIKYTNDTIEIHLQQATELCPYSQIEVMDNGCGIPDEYKKKIFEPFYQIENSNFIRKEGTGIGLAYVKSIIEMHNGKIDIESISAGGTLFRVYIPHIESDKNSPTAEDADALQRDIEAYANDASMTILIVEDNKELLGYLQKMFTKKYRVFVAENGQKGLETLKKFQIDLVITDLVMPEMNGMELCKKIKTDIELCHIPVLILTAKTDMETKIGSLETGADIYIEKPFSIDFLMAQVASLFANREKTCRSFMSSPDLLVSNIADNEVDEKFLLKLNAYIEENMSNVDLSVDMLAEAMHMSRSSIHRKTKGLSGLSPYDFIRLARLKKAAKLLTEGTYRINEICYIVGFNTPSYFSKCFQRQFGVLPRQFGKKQKEESQTE